MEKADKPGGGEAKVEGTAGPISRADTAETPLSTAITLQHLDPPVTVDYASDYDMVRQAGVLSRGESHTGKSTPHLSGNYNTQGQSTVVHLKLILLPLTGQDTGNVRR